MLLTALVVPASASAKDLFGMNTLTWDMGIAVGDAHDVHDSVTLRGGSVDQHFFIVKGLTLGFGISQQVFDDDKPRRTYQLQSGAVTGRLFELSNVFQLKFLADYYFMQDQIIQPFVGIGLGYAGVGRNTSVADITYDRSQSAFALAPEAGVLATAKDAPVGAMVVVRYNYTTADFERIKNYSYVNWGVGMFVRY
jgi:hypothetical protein